MYISKYLKLYVLKRDFRPLETSCACIEISPFFYVYLKSEQIPALKNSEGVCTFVRSSPNLPPDLIYCSEKTAYEPVS